MEDNSSMNQQPVSPAPMHESNSKSVGAIVGAAIVIVLLIAGGFWAWNSIGNGRSNPPSYIPGDADSSSAANVSASVSEVLPPQSTSDDISAIEADLRAMNIEGFSSQTQGDVNALGAAVQ